MDRAYCFSAVYFIHPNIWFNNSLHSIWHMSSWLCCQKKLLWYHFNQNSQSSLLINTWKIKQIIFKFIISLLLLPQKKDISLTERKHTKRNNISWLYYLYSKQRNNIHKNKNNDVFIVTSTLLLSKFKYHPLIYTRNYITSSFFSHLIFHISSDLMGLSLPVS